jgi:hypothetical protein
LFHFIFHYSIAPRFPSADASFHVSGAAPKIKRTQLATRCTAAQQGPMDRAEFNAYSFASKLPFYAMLSLSLDSFFFNLLKQGGLSTSYAMRILYDAPTIPPTSFYHTAWYHNY